MTELEREGHVIHQVVPGGPAYLGGLRDGDQLLQINGEYVHEQEHLRVGQKLKSSGSHVSLCVLDEEAYQRLCFSHMSPASVLPKPVPETCPRPRLCLIQREGRGFGFTATATGGVRGTFLLEVDEGGPAHRAGVPLGARLLEVNGESVSSITMSQLTKKLQNSGPRVTLLVLEASAWDVYEGHGVTLNAVLAETSSLPYRTRKLHLVRGPKGYGFLLRQENCLGGQGQFLRDLDLGLPAQESGMREGDRLLAVNGQSVDGREHEDIVSLIQGSGQQVTMLVISNEGDRFYCEIGLSPLLFYEDDASDCVAAKNMAASTPHLQDQREGKDPQIPTPPAGAQSSEE
ncbi:Na(+)/H(+) exchange regulatory cofactor NHE-RF4 isoform X2 [Ascaphus truei]